MMVRVSPMSDHPTAYLVLASQRSGSTLLVESLRATGMAGEPQEFFQYLPSTSMSPQPWNGSPTSKTSRSCVCSIRWSRASRTWRPQRSGATTSARSAAPPTGCGAASSCGTRPHCCWIAPRACPSAPDPGLLAAIRDVIGSDPVLIHVYRPDVVSQAVSFWRAVQTRVWRGRADPVRDARAEYHAGAIAHVIKLLQAQEEGWRAWFAEENITPIDVSYPYLWRNLTTVVATVLEAARP